MPGGWKRQAELEQPGIGWVNRTLAVSYARLGERISALDSLEALQRCVPDVTISQVVSAIPFYGGLPGARRRRFEQPRSASLKLGFDLVRTLPSG
jgi:hypothetical protein